LFFKVKLTGNANAATGHPVYAIQKVEVIDGSDVLCSLTGKEAQAKHFFDFGKAPNNILAYKSAVDAYASFVIPFGRYMWDEELGLDPTKFNNPQIKITHNYALGGASPNAATLEVYALCFDESAPGLRGFVQAKEIYSYTVTASAYEYIELPRDYPIRRLIIQALAADKAPNDIYDEIKISENHDKRIIIDESVVNLLRFMMAGQLPYEETLLAVSGTTAVDVYVTPSFDVELAGIPVTTAGYLAKEDTPGHNFSVIANASCTYKAEVHGYCPHGALNIDFGDPSYPPDAWDVTGLKNAQLRIKAGSSPGTGTTCQVVVEQYRSY